MGTGRGTATARQLPGVNPEMQCKLQRWFRVLRFIGSDMAARAALRLYQRPARRKLDESDVATLERAKVTNIESGNEMLRVLQWGTRGPMVLLVHGWGSHAPRYANFVEAILERGWRALAFDAPGHGLSSGRRIGIAHFRRAIDTVIAAYGPVDVVIAHSFGALAAASLLAEPAGARVRAAVLVSMPKDAGYILDSFLLALDLDERTAERVRVKFGKREGRLASSISAVEMAPRIHCPVLLVHDRNDGIVPLAHAEEIVQLLPEGKLLLTQEMGHSALLRDESTIGAAMGFLDGVLGSGAKPGPATPSVP